MDLAGLVENIGECYKTVEDFKTQLRNVEKAEEENFWSHNTALLPSLLEKGRRKTISSAYRSKVVYCLN